MLINLFLIPETVILGWFVDPSEAKAAIKDDKLIEEEDVECRPEKIPCSVGRKR